MVGLFIPNDVRSSITDKFGWEQPGTELARLFFNKEKELDFNDGCWVSLKFEAYGRHQEFAQNLDSEEHIIEYWRDNKIDDLVEVFYHKIKQVQEAWVAICKELNGGN